MSPEQLKQEKIFAVVRIFSGFVVFLMLGYSFLVNFFNSSGMPEFPVILSGVMSLVGLGFSLHFARQFAKMAAESQQ